MNVQMLKGTSQLIKIISRQHRFQIIAWLMGIVFVSLAVASSYQSVYQNESDKQGFALTMQNPAMVAMLGPGYEADEYLLTIGTQFAHEMLLFTLLAIAIMNILLVGSSTRTDEETGRTEVLRSLPIGRLSYLAASIIVVGCVNLIIALITGIGLHLLNIEGNTLESSILYGAILGLGGFVFAAITSLFAQITDSSRGTKGLAFGTLVIAYFIRAVGDVVDEKISFFSPLGWLLRTDVFINNYWWPIVISSIFSIVLIIITFYLNSIRDLNSGFLPTRKGRTNASSMIKSILGLVYHLQRIKIIAWGIGIFALGAAFGAVMGDMEKYFSDNEFVQMMLAQMGDFSITDQFISMLMGIMSLISVIPVIMTILKLKSEENHYRTEHFYSRAISRNRVLGSFTVLAIIESIIYLMLLALGLWLAANTMMENPISFATIMQSALVYLPAMFFMIGVTVFLVGFAPKFTSVIWLYFAFCYVAVYVGGLLNFPEWVMYLSAFELIPKVPGEEVDIQSLFVLLVLFIVLLFIGFKGYNKRDIAG